MTAESWPTDARFRAFASRIADAVTVHLANGGRIDDHNDIDGGGIDHKCKCPLGTIATVAYPQGSAVASNLGFPSEWGVYFAMGFDGVGRSSRVADNNAAYRLGWAYRERFIGAHEGSH